MAVIVVVAQLLRVRGLTDGHRHLSGCSHVEIEARAGPPSGFRRS